MKENITSEEKREILTDLVGRLVYRPKAAILNGIFDHSVETVTGYAGRFVVTLNTEYDVDRVRLFLRPMSSMTEEELGEYEAENDIDVADSSLALKLNMEAKKRVYISSWHHGVDWLNARHFDYRGLIERGLALEAPEGMYA